MTSSSVKMHFWLPFLYHFQWKMNLPQRLVHILIPHKFLALTFHKWKKIIFIISNISSKKIKFKANTVQEQVYLKLRQCTWDKIHFKSALLHSPFLHFIWPKSSLKVQRHEYETCLMIHKLWVNCIYCTEYTWVSIMTRKPSTEIYVLLTWHFSQFLSNRFLEK